MNKWDARFFRDCRSAAMMSKDPSTQVGAVIVRPNKALVMSGYNGFPRGCDDDPAVYADRERKLRRTIHAEKNAIVEAKTDLTGCTIYTWPLPPCSQCAALIIQSGIKRVLFMCDEIPYRWRDDVAEALIMFEEAGVSYKRIGRVAEKIASGEIVANG